MNAIIYYCLDCLVHETCRPKQKQRVSLTVKDIQKQPQIISVYDPSGLHVGCINSADNLYTLNIADISSQISAQSIN